MNFGFDQADQSYRLRQKNNKFNIVYIIIQCVYLVASKYGKMYHVKTLWVALVQLGCVSNISRRKRKLNTCTDMLLDSNAFQCQVLLSCSGPLWIE